MQGAAQVTGFIVIGSLGLAVVLLTLILGDIFDSIFEAFNLDAGGGILSAPVLGSFLAAFGFGAALIMFSTGANAAVGALGGLGSGVVVGGLSLGIMRGLINMPTDPSMDTGDLVGATGTVVTPIPADGLGEVTIRYLGHLHKYNARAPEPLPAGTMIVVTTVMSSSAVMVRKAEES